MSIRRGIFESNQIGGRITAMILISWKDMNGSSLLEKGEPSGRRHPFQKKEIFPPNLCSSIQERGQGIKEPFPMEGSLIPVDGPAFKFLGIKGFSVTKRIGPESNGTASVFPDGKKEFTEWKRICRKLC